MELPGRGLLSNLLNVYTFVVAVVLYLPLYV